MRSLLPIAAIFLCSGAMAQPILTAANMNPVAGDTYTLTACDSTGLAAAATGPGRDKIWDYSHLVAATAATASANSFESNLIDSFTTIRFVPCSAVSASDPSATIAIMRYDSVYSAYFEPAGITSDSFPEFFITDSSQYYYTIPLPPIPTHNRQPITLLKYPFTYNSTLADTTPYSERDFAFTPDFGYRSLNSITADAYGTLKMPGHTYTNALRLHIITVHFDTGLLWTTWVYVHYTSESYQWFVPGFHVPVLEVDNDTLGGAPAGAEYYTGTYDSSAHGEGVVNTAYSLQDVTTYPNPATDELHVAFTSLTSEPAALRLTDITGRCVQAMRIEKTTPGMNEASMPLVALTQGIYFLQLQQGGEVVNRKVSVMR